jgi:disease resistance protein RPM1
METAVVSVTLGAAGILLQKLGNIVADNWTSLGGVRHEIQELKDDLVTLTACLRDLDSAGDDTRSELVRRHDIMSIQQPPLPSSFGFSKLFQGT